MKGDWADGWSGLPEGGIDARKYAAIMWALGKARGALSTVGDKWTQDDIDHARPVLRCTSTSAIARALGLRERELSIDCEDHLTLEELDHLRTGPIEE
jgi:hypothetical protein